MKNLLTKLAKHTAHVTEHLHTHHKKYLGGLFASFAVVKTFVLLAGVLGIAQLGSTFAAEGFSCDNVTDVSPSECEALVTLYNSTDGDNWTDNTGWLTSTTVCNNWHGIYCSFGDVNNIDLGENNLSGTTADLSGLPGLASLNLRSSNLSSITLNGLTNLRQLYLDNNQFSSIDLAGVPNLQQLNLGSNQFTGIDLAGLTELNYLNLSSNQFSNINLSELSNLSSLYLSNNQLTTIDLAGLTNLQNLDLGSNQLSGDISQFCDFTQLNRIGLNNNIFEGEIPSCFFEFTFSDEGRSRIDYNMLDVTELTGAQVEYLDQNFSSQNDGPPANRRNQYISSNLSITQSIEQNSETAFTVDLSYRNIGPKDMSGIMIYYDIVDGITLTSDNEYSMGSVDNTYGISGDSCYDNLYTNSTGAYRDAVETLVYVMTQGSMTTLEFLQQQLEYGPGMSDRGISYIGDGSDIGKFWIDFTENTNDGSDGTFIGFMNMVGIDITRIDGCGTGGITVYAFAIGNLVAGETGSVSLSLTSDVPYTLEMFPSTARIASTYAMWGDVNPLNNISILGAPIPGCMDSGANNYNPDATETDGSCTYTISGCMLPDSSNYNPEANQDDGSCINIGARNVTISGTTNVGETLIGGYTYQGDNRQTTFSVTGNINYFLFDSSGASYITLYDNDGLTSTVQKRDGSAYIQLGETLSGSMEYLLLDGNNVPYITISTNGGAQSIIQKRDGNSWIQLGNSFDGYLQYFLFDTNDVPYISNNQNDGLASTVQKWDGSSWIQLGETLSGSMGYFLLDENDVPYINIYDNNTSTSTIQKWDGSSWIQLGETFSGSMGYFLLDGNNVPYISTQNNEGTESTIQKRDGNVWVQLGDTYEGYIGYFLFDTNDTPYITISNDEGTESTIQRRDGNTWTQMGDIFTESINYLLFDGNDVPYISTSNKNLSQSQSIVQKRDGNTWIQLGNTFEEYINYLLFDGNNTPYIQIYNKEGEAAIMIWDPSTITAEGDSTFQRYRDGVAITGATSQSYTIVAADQAKDITFEVTPKSVGEVEGNPVASEAKVVNSFPVASDVVILGTPSTGETLTGRYIYSDVDGGWDTIGTFESFDDFLLSTDNVPYIVVSNQSSRIGGVAIGIGGVANGAIGFNIAQAGGVGVKRRDGSSWVQLGGDFENVEKLLLDGNDIPYVISYVNNKDTMQSDYSIQKRNGSEWIQVGDTIFNSIGYISLDGNNIPYITTYDTNSSTSIVQKRDGSTWIGVGDPITDSINNLLVDGNNVPYITTSVYDNNINESISTIQKWDGSTWIQLGNLFTGYLQYLLFDTNDVLYINYGNNNGESFIQKRDGNSWIQFGETFEQIDNFLLDGNNVPYISKSVENMEGNGMQLKGKEADKSAIMKRDGASWVQVGDTYIPGKMGFVLDGEGTPYIIDVYRDEDAKTETNTIKKRDGDSWRQVGDLIDGEAYISFDGNNIPYIVNYTYNNDTDQEESNILTYAEDTESNSSYQWYRSGKKISGATEISYVFTSSDVDKTIVFEVTPAASNGSSPGIAVRSEGFVADDTPETITYTKNKHFEDNAGFTATGGLTFTGNEIIHINNDIEEKNTIEVATDGFAIKVVEGERDGILYAPTETTDPAVSDLPASANTRTVLLTVQAGGSGASLEASGGTFTISFVVPNGTIGDTIPIYRSEDGITWDVNTPDTTCELDADLVCTFETDHLSYFTVVQETTSNNNGSAGGGGGGGITTDVKAGICEARDCSDSYYDGVCGVCEPSKHKAADNTGKTLLIDSATGFAAEITAVKNTMKGAFTNELVQAYVFAKDIGITTIQDIDKAMLNEPLIRQHAAKMMVNYATNILGMQADGTRTSCNYTDMNSASTEMQLYARLACQMGIMGVNSDAVKTPAKKFNGTAQVTRDQFGTMLSRTMYANDPVEINSCRYCAHLERLKNDSIMTKIDTPSNKEVRGYVWLMMMRAYQNVISK